MPRACLSASRGSQPAAWPTGSWRDGRTAAERTRRRGRAAGTQRAWRGSSRAWCGKSGRVAWPGQLEYICRLAEAGRGCRSGDKTVAQRWRGVLWRANGRNSGRLFCTWGLACRDLTRSATLAPPRCAAPPSWPRPAAAAQSRPAWHPALGFSSCEQLPIRPLARSSRLS